MLRTTRAERENSQLEHSAHHLARSIRATYLALLRELSDGVLAKVVRPTSMALVSSQFEGGCGYSGWNQEKNYPEFSKHIKNFQFLNRKEQVKKDL